MYEYPFGNGQQLNLDWFLAEWKNLLAAWEAEKNGIAGALDAEIAKAEAALADVFAARDAAAQSAENADASERAAAQSASDASGYLATVRADANTAHNAAQNAAQSESNAAESAQTALASKNNAANSERNAAQSEQNALGYKNTAAQSASDADASKSAAAQSAADADASKSAAAQSAEDAENAAASVEDSAQQIETNTTDIANLKESVSNDASALPFTIASRGAYISWTGGIANNSERYAMTDYIPLKLYRALKYKQIRIEQTSSSAGIAFFDENKRYISGVSVLVAQGTGSFGYASALSTVTIPTNAKYVRCTTINDESTYGEFEIYGISPVLYQSILDTALIAPRLNNMQAQSPLPVNSLRIVDNTLYRVTTPIAANGQLIIGTNVVATTVAEVLKSLLN